MINNQEEEEVKSFRDTVHLPKDAGEYSEDLLVILNRIPDGWGKWISCNKGWYPLIIELDKKLSAIYPDYEIHQVKEKYATLRYYFGLPSPEHQCCKDIDNLAPVRGPVNPAYLSKEDKSLRTIEMQYKLSEWFHTEYCPHFDSAEHEATLNAYEPEGLRQSNLYEEMSTIVEKYEKLSSRTCEICSSLHGEVLTQSHWLIKTLCPPCGKNLNYTETIEE